MSIPVSAYITDGLPVDFADGQGLVHMSKTGGLKAMMKGNGANCIRIIPNSATKFLCYEHISR